MRIPKQLGLTPEMPSVVLCDVCRKPISIRGVRVEAIQQGEYQVSFFRCVHCGKRYQITTTDKTQRQFITEWTTIPKKIRVAKERGFRPETVQRYESRRKRLADAIRKRLDSLRETGERILNGEEVVANGTENGPENPDVLPGN